MCYCVGQLKVGGTSVNAGAQRKGSLALSFLVASELIDACESCGSTSSGKGFCSHDCGRDLRRHRRAVIDFRSCFFAGPESSKHVQYIPYVLLPPGIRSCVKRRPNIAWTRLAAKWYQLCYLLFKLLMLCLIFSHLNYPQVKLNHNQLLDALLSHPHS